MDATNESPSAKPTNEEICAAVGAKRIKSAWARLIFLGYSTECSRCGGTGHHSRNAQGATTCYKCFGAKHTALTLTRMMLVEVSARVAAGDLNPYLAAVRERAEAKALLAPAMSAIDAMWCCESEVGVHTLYRELSRSFMFRHLPGGYSVSGDDPSLSLAAGLVNDAWGAAREAVDEAEHGRLAPQKALEIVANATEIVREANAIARAIFD